MLCGLGFIGLTACTDAWAASSASGVVHASRPLSLSFGAMVVAMLLPLILSSRRQAALRRQVRLEGRLGFPLPGRQSLLGFEDILARTHSSHRLASTRLALEAGRTGPAFPPHAAFAPAHTPPLSPLLAHFAEFAQLLPHGTAESGGRQAREGGLWIHALDLLAARFRQPTGHAAHCPKSSLERLAQPRWRLAVLAATLVECSVETLASVEVTLHGRSGRRSWLPTKGPMRTHPVGPDAYTMAPRPPELLAQAREVYRGSAAELLQQILPPAHYLWLQEDPLIAADLLDHLTARRDTTVGQMLCALDEACRCEHTPMQQSPRQAEKASANLAPQPALSRQDLPMAQAPAAPRAAV